MLSAFGYGLVQYGRSLENAEWQEATIKAVEAARITEKNRQESINAAIQKQYDSQVIINNDLLSDINELQDRPARSVSRNPEADCKGATGADLSRRDAAAFIRLAARADRLRSALRTCYEYADSL